MSAETDRPAPPLRGTLTALVTPFKGGQVDEEALVAQVDRQLEAGVDGLVPAGTTGESPTLTHEEHVRVVAVVAERVNKRVPVIAGTGSSSTAEAVALTKASMEAGADAALVVAPYYNRPGPSGIVEHYKRVCGDGGLPVVVYNIPSRTGVSIGPDLYDRLAGVEGVFAVKEASGDLVLASHVAGGSDLILLAGDDALCVPMMAIGAAGVISVASNLVPFEMKAMTDAALRDEWAEARRIHRALFRLFRALFVETNPVPVKYALNLLGYDSGEVRLPLLPPSSPTEDLLRGQLQALGLLGSGLHEYIDPRD